MENMGVRYIPTDRSVREGKLIWSGNKPALCFRGEKKAHCVIIGELEITTVDLPLDTVEKSPAVPDSMGQAAGIPYSPEKFIQRVTGTGRPLSEEARALLQSVNGKKKPLPPSKARIEVKTAPPKPGTLKTAGAELIIVLSQEYKLPTPKLRRFLRSQGLNAPYTDEKLVRNALKKLKKGGK